MSAATPERRKLNAALKAYEKAAAALYKAAADYARAETRALSLRYPKRRVEYFCGMGANTIDIEKHGNYRGRRCYQVNEAFGDHLRGKPIPAPEYMATLAQMENDTRLPGLGDGVFAFKNGKAQK